jgi:NMD protein affecting ribosome stability and mRNA decay
MENVFKDDGRDISSFGNNIMVVCPNCTKRGLVFNNYNTPHEKHRFVCHSCGLNKKRDMHAEIDWRLIGHDPYFSLSLWLKTEYSGNILCAYNEEHLKYLENYISAKHRQHMPDDNGGWQNQSLASRLPKWMSAADNRESLLQTINKLRKTL